MIIDTDDFDEIFIDELSLGGEVMVQLRDGYWFGQYSRYHGSGYRPATKKLATRLCGNVFIMTGYGESEGVRLRQALPACNFIYPQVRFEYCDDDPEFHTVYERDANRAAPFKMVMWHVTGEFRKTVEPYLADAEYSSPRLFWMQDEVYMLLKMRF